MRCRNGGNIHPGVVKTSLSAIILTDGTSVYAGFLVALLGIVIGYGARRISHAIVPFRDPIFIALCTIEILIMIFIEQSDAMFLVSVMLDLGYIIGYAISRPFDTISILKDDEAENMMGFPLVYYTHDSQQYFMPQKFKAILFSYFGVRYPMNMPVNEISRTHMITTSNGWYSMKINTVSVFDYHIDYDTKGLCQIGWMKTKDENGNVTAKEPRYLKYVVIEKLTVIMSEDSTDDPSSHKIKNDVWKDAIKKAKDSSVKCTKLEIQNNEDRYNAGIELVGCMFDAGVDGRGISEEIEKMIEEERKLRNGCDSDGSVQ